MSKNKQKRKKKNRTRKPIRIIVTVNNKDQLEKLHRLREHKNLKFDIVSTGGTAKYLRGKGIACRDVASVTGEPESCEGLVKVLHPRIFRPILHDRRSPKHVKELRRRKEPPIGVVLVDLYEFATAEALKNIDIGGASLLRAGAKAGGSVLVVSELADWDTAIDALMASTDGKVPEELRITMAAKALRTVSRLDAQAADWMERLRDGGDSPFGEGLTH